MDRAFVDRLEAGTQLARALESYRNSDAVILGLARGGVAVGYAVSKSLHLPLRALVVRKLGAPGNPELAVGAVSETGVRWVDHEIARITGASESYIEQEATLQAAQAQRRQREYAASSGVDVVRGRIAIIVDDGIATGSSAWVAIQSARQLGASRLVLAVPTASQQAVANLRPQVDSLVVLHTPDPFVSVGLHYQDFGQVSDSEVVGCLRDAGEMERDNSRTGSEQSVEIPAGNVLLSGDLSIPPDAIGIVLFAHGSGSGRLSPRNRSVARELQEAGIATLLVDLLTPEEARDRRNVFSIPLLTQRLLDCFDFLRRLPATSALPVGFFGASTGAGAALVAAAERGNGVHAVVSRGGRPDLAGEHLARVTAPTLLIVGGSDLPVLTLNEQALAELRCPKALSIVAGATHLFEEPGTLEQVAQLARDWFRRYFTVRR